MPVSKTTAWVIGVIAVLAIGATCVLTLGISILFWGPMLVALGVGMWAVWAGRTRRLAMENRSEDEVKDPLHADPPWPQDDRIIDDRLPEP